MPDFSSLNTQPNRRQPGLPPPIAQFLNKLGPAVTEHVEFFGAFIRRPARVGSFAPSSPELARAMLRGCDLKNARMVVELGPGTGAFTNLILEGLGKKTRFFALELDENNARSLHKRFPDVDVYNDSAEHIQKYLNRHGRKKADYVISGLPWGNMTFKLQERILNPLVKALEPGGMFVTFAYVHACWFPSARRFRERLEEQFADVRTSRIVWRNAPPAFVYRCRLTA